MLTTNESDNAERSRPRHRFDKINVHDEALNDGVYFYQPSFPFYIFFLAFGQFSNFFEYKNSNLFEAKQC